MNIDDILTEHLQLCEDTYALLSEENHALKHKGGLDADFLERKSEHMRLLDQSLAALKGLQSSPQAKSADTNKIIDKAQKRLMQIFLLDRENERLLNKFSRTSGKKSDLPPPRKPQAYQEAALHAQAQEEAPEPTHTHQGESPPPSEDTPAPQPRRLHRAYQQHLQANEDAAQDFFSEDNEL